MTRRTRGVRSRKETCPMYKRLELHNHTTESDSSLTCRELLEYMLSDRVDAFGLTDHNTISGHAKMRALLAKSHAPIECIYGMEYTTYYGHLLCLNLTEYVPWEDIDRRRPEKLFRAVREKGALAGIAHPFSYGEPFARGCRWEMEVTDYSVVDFIEIFYDPEPLHEVNEPALALWESLVLSGRRIAATCGMDLHGKWSFANQYATFIEGKAPGGGRGKDSGDIAGELARAIHSQRTWVSRGPLLICRVRRADSGPAPAGGEGETGGYLEFSVLDSGKPGFQRPASLQAVCKTPQGTISVPLDGKGAARLPLGELHGADILLPQLYGKDLSIQELLCVAPPLYLNGTEEPATGTDRKPA